MRFRHRISFQSHLFRLLSLNRRLVIILFILSSFLFIHTYEKAHPRCDNCVNISYPDGTIINVPRCYPLLINFAQGCCRRAQRQNCQTGFTHGIRQCLKMNEHVFDHDPRFMMKNKHILERTRGGGYWLWKPYVILRELQIASDRDIIIYSDAAVNFVRNIKYLTKLTEYQDVITFNQDWKESIWTKRDTFIIMDADRPSFYDSLAGVASYIVLRRSSTSINFVSEWLTYAQDSRALTDDDNVLGKNNFEDFREHRHDQSILSLLAKKWNLTIYPDPSQWGEGRQRPYPTIFVHHRSKA